MVRRAVRNLDPVAACVLTLVALSALASGCAARAQQTVELPPLRVPDPPARIVEPAPPPVVPTEAPPLEDAPEAPPPSPRPAPRAERPPAKPPEQPVPSEPAPPRPAETPAPALALSPAGQDAGAVERDIRQRIARTGQDLARIDLQSLSSDARTQHAAARRFLALAEQALKEQNAVYATTLVDKAATLAAQLARR